MTVVHVVTLLEEMPVQETTDAINELTRLGIPVGSVIVNATRKPLLAEVSVVPADIRRGLAAAGLDADRDTVAGLVDEAEAYQARLAVEKALRTELAGLGKPLIELPFLPEGVTPAGLVTLAEALM
jgi:anion-transporting  ArsA/GET3 family ATPase